MHHAFVQCVAVFVCGFLVSSFLVAGAKRGRRRGERLVPRRPIRLGADPVTPEKDSAGPVLTDFERLMAFGWWQTDAMLRVARAGERLATCAEIPWDRSIEIACQVGVEAAAIRKRHLGEKEEFTEDGQASATDQTIRWCAQKMGFLPVREK